MNLAIEYLVRTGAIKNFFQTPSSICLESGKKKIVVSFGGERLGGEHVGDSCLCITHWDLSDLDEHNMPKLVRHQVLPEDIFEDENSILPGCKLLKYWDEPIETRRNSYSHPMDSVVFRHYTSHLMNSSLHRRSRRNWLWESFRERVFDLRRTKRHYGEEQSVVREGYPKEWSLWRNWCRNMLPDPEPEVAGELMFLSSYKTKPSLILHYPWTYTSSSTFYA